MRSSIGKTGAVLAAGLLIAALVIAGCAKGAKEVTKYHCPMHPTYISDKPGDCPICGMRLVPLGTKEAPATVAAYTCPLHPEVTSDQPGTCSKCGTKLVPTEQVEGSGGKVPESKGARKVLYYRSPMDPSVTSPVPAKDSMGMDFIPVYEEQAASAAGAVPGMADVSMTAEGLRLSGVLTAPAVRDRLALNVRTVGIITPNETLIRHVHTKISGWIEKLFVNFTGQMVRRGEPVLTIYSPDLVATQEEFLRALQAADLFSKSDLPEIRKGGQELLEGARRRLELYDVPEDVIETLQRTKAPQRTVTLLSNASGYVTAKEVFEGKQVEPGMELFTITDLSRIWVEADLYEYEARAVKVGQMGTLTLPFDPSLTLKGRVVYILPYLSPESRTLKVRLEFPNLELKLRPAMYANVELQVDAGVGIVVPDSAVMDTGERQMIFVQKEGNVFEPREVKVGIRSEGKAMVLSGLSEGERVAIRANFLLDSESRLRAAIAGMTSAPPAAHSGHGGEK
ncbi:MAG: efflux RND transporter periplasmic adaptor subunit [Acidobacteriota bacterium]